MKIEEIKKMKIEEIEKKMKIEKICKHDESYTFYIFFSIFFFRISNIFVTRFRLVHFWFLS